MASLRGWFVPLTLIMTWAAASGLRMFHSPLFVPLDKVALAPFVDPDGRQLWPALGVSLLRFAAGFLVGASGGIALGFVLGMSRLADRAISPSFNALRQVTLFAWIPLLTAWFGDSEIAKLIFIATSAFFPIVLNTHQGLRTISTAYLEVAQVMRLTGRQRITRLLLPAALPDIFAGVQLAIMIAWIGTVGAEYAIGMGQGIGAFIAQSREVFRMDLVIPGVFALALVGYSANALCERIFRYLLRWRGATS